MKRNDNNWSFENYANHFQLHKSTLPLPFSFSTNQLFYMLPSSGLASSSAWRSFGSLATLAHFRSWHAAATPRASGSRRTVVARTSLVRRSLSTTTDQAPEKSHHTNTAAPSDIIYTGRYAHPIKGMKVRAIAVGCLSF